MAYVTAKRISDGLLGWTQSYNTPPDQDKIILNMGVNVLGGISADYVYQDLTDEQGQVLENIKPRRSKLVNGVFSHAEPIILTLDTDTVTANGQAIINFSIDLQDPTYNGEVEITIQNPDKTQVSVTVSATSGNVNREISTEYIGSHLITVETLPHGLAFLFFEGV